MRHGIDLKTHSQCQRSGPIPQIRGSQIALGHEVRVFISGVSWWHHPSREAAKDGGAYRDRTDDPLLAKQVLSQLS